MKLVVWRGKTPLILSLVLLLGMAIAPIYGVIGAVQTSQGQDFQYLWVGSWCRNLLD